MTSEAKASHPTREILIGPTNRQAYLEEQLQLDGLTGLQEDPNAAYCALSLTNTPAEAKTWVAHRQEVLKGILEASGITAYDPGTAPLSPDLNLTAGPDEIYRTDLARVAGARFFTAFDTFPSTGVGVEEAEARKYNRMAVILHDKGIRTSRMQPNVAMHLGFDDLEEQAGTIAQLFQTLKEYTPGRGLEEGKPVLLGFKEGETEGINLSEFVVQEFPSLVYEFDGKKPALEFTIKNPHVLFDKTNQ